MLILILCLWIVLAEDLALFVTDGFSQWRYADWPLRIFAVLKMITLYVAAVIAAILIKVVIL